MNNQQDYVTIGAFTYHAELTFLRYGSERITIGKYCSIADKVKIFAGGNHRTNTVSTYPFDTMLLKHSMAPGELDRSYAPGQDTVIGNDVWIGYGAMVMGGVTVGDGAVIGAGAVVMTDVPAYGIAVGNPARVNKYRFNQRTVESLLEIKWWDWPDEMVRVSVDKLYLPIEEW